MTPIQIRLRDLRAARGFTQEELASVAQVRQGTISAIERGVTTRIDLAVLERLAKALDVEPADLLKPISHKRGR